ncbi:hypothetical protein ACIHEJ_07555 [Streptomyces sp. NPDC052301]|uniref:hypothetical protein n=1 Tax=Streptomyces sp. NPDC052301 TaxID=3365687 RepID=UPI0037D3C609
MQRAFALIRRDIRDEENLLPSRLQNTTDTDRLRTLGTLGTTWAAVRQTTPTHPHPVIPRRPPGSALLGVPLTAALGIGDPPHDAEGDRGLVGMLGTAFVAVAAQRPKRN